MARFTDRHLLKVGSRATDFTLRDRDGVEFTLASLVANGPVLLVFFKISCEVCQLTFPYLERLYRNGRGLQIVGISQDDAEATTEFTTTYGVSLPILLDKGYRVSATYGLTNVPTLYLVEPDQQISFVGAGFVRMDLDKLALRMQTALFQKSDYAPYWKAG